MLGEAKMIIILWREMLITVNYISYNKKTR